jgi:hypothetical protein
MRTAILVLAAMPAFAHRLDEYLQGSLVSVEKNQLRVQMTLTPGVAIFPQLFSSIDTNSDGVISDAEKRAYASRVLNDLSLSIDGYGLMPRLQSVQFSSTDDMKEGLDEIHLEFNADLPAGGRARKLVFDNRHQSRIAAYQVNCLVSRDPDIRIQAQDRNESQSHYELKFEQTGPAPFTLWAGRFGWLGAIPLLLFTRLVFVWRKRT